jgi:hypothetical protein
MWNKIEKITMRGISTMKNKIYVKTVAIVGVCIYVAVLLFFIYFYRVDSNWLSFLGAYIGSFIGAVATFIAFYFTFKSNENQQDNMREEMKEQQRLQNLPLFDYTTHGLGALNADLAVYVTINGISDRVNNNCSNNTMIRILNVGKNVAVNTFISQNVRFRIGHIQPGESRIIQFLFPDVSQFTGFSPVRIEFTSWDGISYYQELSFTCNGRSYEVSISEIKFNH